MFPQEVHDSLIIGGGLAMVTIMLILNAAIMLEKRSTKKKSK